MILGAADGNPFGPHGPAGPAGPRAYADSGSAHGIVAVWFLPPLLVPCWAVAQAVRTRRTSNRGDLAA